MPVKNEWEKFWLFVIKPKNFSYGFPKTRRNTKIVTKKFIPFFMEIFYCVYFRYLWNCEIALYADDTDILSRERVSIVIIKKIENGMKMVEKYYEKWKIKINANDSFHVH